MEPGASAAVALRVGSLPLSDAVTVVFHGRRDLGTIQTYVARGRHGAGASLTADELLRVPCDLDLGDAEDREEAERMYAEQAAALRDALAAADTVLDVWREPLEDLAHAHVDVDPRLELDVELPAHRLLPTALVAADRQIVVAPVCGARPLAEGRPPLGIACLQQDVVRVYPLPDDPEACLRTSSTSPPTTPTAWPTCSSARSSPSRGSSSCRTSTRPPNYIRPRAAAHEDHRDRLRDVPVPRDLAAARPRARRHGRRALRGHRDPARPGARGRRRRARRDAALRARPDVLPRHDRADRQARAAGRRRDPQLRAVHPGGVHRPDRHGARRLAHGATSGFPVVQCVSSRARAR